MNTIDYYILQLDFWTAIGGSGRQYTESYETLDAAIDAWNTFSERNDQLLIEWDNDRAPDEEITLTLTYRRLLETGYDEYDQIGSDFDVVYCDIYNLDNTTPDWEDVRQQITEKSVEFDAEEIELQNS